MLSVSFDRKSVFDAPELLLHHFHLYPAGIVIYHTMIKDKYGHSTHKLII